MDDGEVREADDVERARGAFGKLGAAVARHDLPAARAAMAAVDFEELFSVDRMLLNVVIDPRTPSPEAVLAPVAFQVLLTVLESTAPWPGNPDERATPDANGYRGWSSTTEQWAAVSAEDKAGLRSLRREAIEAMGELSTEKRCRASAADDSVARRAMTAAAALLRLRDLEEPEATLHALEVLAHLSDGDNQYVILELCHDLL